MPQKWKKALPCLVAFVTMVNFCQVFGVLDGGRMPTATYMDANLQNEYFEGLNLKNKVTNLIAVNFNGEIIHTALNFPGSWYDSKLAQGSGLYFPKLSNEMTLTGYGTLAVVGNWQNFQQDF